MKNEHITQNAYRGQKAAGGWSEATVESFLVNCVVCLFYLQW